MYSSLAKLHTLKANSYSLHELVVSEVVPN